MRWQNESSRPVIFNYMNALDIVCDAYYEGYINWNVYQNVRDKIKTNMNGIWMFKQKKDEGYSQNEAKMDIQENNFFIEDLAIKYGQGEFNFPERIENIYKVLGRVRNYKYSDIDEAEPYNYNKNNSLPVPPSYIDTFICDIWHQIITGFKLPPKEYNIDKIKKLEISYKDIDEKLVEKAVKIYCKRQWYRIAGWRPYTHWYFIRSLTNSERKSLIKEIVKYIMDNGIRDVEKAIL